MSTPQDNEYLAPYNQELAQAGALLCWANGDGRLRYIGPTTEAAACGCFLWVEGPYKGTYASYRAGDLRMAPEAFRPDGWYWIRKQGWGDQYEDWVPAEWRQASKSWASATFGGVSDAHVLVGPALVLPDGATNSFGAAPMTEAQFKALYITQFLASYMASRYEDDCMSGHQGNPHEHQPVEDAGFLADCAWKLVQKHAPDSEARYGGFELQKVSA